MFSKKYTVCPRRSIKSLGMNRCFERPSVGKKGKKGENRRKMV